jgi:hypothetical protein
VTNTFANNFVTNYFDGSLALTDGLDRPAEFDPFGASADNIAAEETRLKAEWFAWADEALDLPEAEFEVELDDAAKRFGKSKPMLRQIVKARRNEKRKQEEARRRPNDDAP